MPKLQIFSNFHMQRGILRTTSHKSVLLGMSNTSTKYWMNELRRKMYLESSTFLKKKTVKQYSRELSPALLASLPKYIQYNLSCCSRSATYTLRALTALHSPFLAMISYTPAVFSIFVLVSATYIYQGRSFKSDNST